MHTTLTVVALTFLAAGASGPAEKLSASGPVMPSMDTMTDGTAAAHIITAAATLVSAATPLILRWLRRRRRAKSKRVTRIGAKAKKRRARRR